MVINEPKYKCGHSSKAVIINTTEESLSTYIEWKNSKSNLCFRCWINKRKEESITKIEKWMMPDWMEQYKDLIVNTGGNGIEELVNDHSSNTCNNAIRALFCVAVKSQVILLEKLHKKGLI